MKIIHLIILLSTVLSNTGQCHKSRTEKEGKLIEKEKKKNLSLFADVYIENHNRCTQKKYFLKTNKHVEQGHGVQDQHTKLTIFLHPGNLQFKI